MPTISTVASVDPIVGVHCALDGPRGGGMNRVVSVLQDERFDRVCVVRA